MLCNTDLESKVTHIRLIFRLRPVCSSTRLRVFIYGIKIEFTVKVIENINEIMGNSVKPLQANFEMFDLITTVYVWGNKQTFSENINIYCY